MIKKIVHFSDLHLRLFKDHDLYRRIVQDMLDKFKEIGPDRIVFTGDLVHSKNQMTPELINLMSWVMVETAKICKCVYIIGNHDFLENNMDRVDALSPTTIIFISFTGIFFFASLLISSFVMALIISFCSFT